MFPGCLRKCCKKSCEKCCILGKNSNINVSLETVFEFNQKDKINDLQILDDIQNFIDYIRNGLLSSTNDKQNHKLKHSSQIMMQDDGMDLRKKSRPNKLQTRKKAMMKSSTKIIMLTGTKKVISNRVKDRAKSVSYNKKKPLKPLINLFAMIIRALTDDDIISVIDFAHNETQKFKDNRIRRAMNTGLGILKETPVDTIREFLNKIADNEGKKLTSNEHHKLNKAFEKFFTELEWLLLQMDPETASLLTLLFHDLEKVFVRELDKSHLKVMTDTNHDLFDKLQRNPYIIGSDENGLLNIVTDALKSLIFDNYGNLNKNEKIWVKSKLKPLWENVTSFFDNGKNKKNAKKSKRIDRKYNKGNWFVWKPKEKYESSVSLEEASRALVTLSLRLENADREDTINLYTKVAKNSNQTTIIANNGSKFTNRKREKTISKDKNQDIPHATKAISHKGLIVTTTVTYKGIKRNRALNISRLTSSLMDYMPFNVTYNKAKLLTNSQASDTDSIDEIDKANKYYSEKRNSSMQQRFRVLDSYNSTITVTRTTLKPRTTFKYKKITRTTQSRKRQSYKYENQKYNENKDSDSMFHKEDNFLSDSYEGQKPSRTTLKVTTPSSHNIYKKYNGKSLRRHPTLHLKPKPKLDLDTFEDDSNDSDNTDKTIESDKTNGYAQSLINRIDNIEEKIQNIEKLIIQTKKTTNWFLDLKFSGEKDTTRVVERDKSAISKAISTTVMTTPKTNVKYINVQDNEVIERPTARAVFKTSNHVTLSSAKAKTTENTKDPTKQTTVTKAENEKMSNNSDNFSDKAVNKTTGVNEWIIKI